MIKYSVFILLLSATACDTGGSSTSTVLVNDAASNIYGGLSVSGSNRAPRSFVPITSSVAENSASAGFVQGIWLSDSTWSLSVAINDGYVSGNGVDLMFSDALGISFRCQSGFLGSLGDCSSATFNHVTRTVSIVDVSLVGPQAEAVTLDGELFY